MDWVGDLFDYLKSQRVVQGPGVFIGDAVGGGKQITVIAGAGGAGDGPCPFETSTTISGGTAKVIVLPGTVNQFIATNAFATFAVDKTGTFYVKASIVTDGQDVTSFSIAVNGAEPNTQLATPSSLPTAFDVLLAIIKDGVAYRTIGCGSIAATPAQAFITDKPSPAGPGELTYIPYYVWEISVA